MVSLIALLVMLFQLQKLLYSATLSQNPEKLQQLNLFQPKLFTSVFTPPTPAREPVGPQGELKESGDPGAGRDSGVDKADTKKGSERKGEFVGKYTTPESLTVRFRNA